ncbi:CASP8-associated protein 2 isoform X2 [Rana temporaria]|uniref:CASP8-associated protein 2 isoform X2 n=1 Tax=Rana temporaria TaxID=8407 RepID=UPI001AADDDE1|nr:CASP8-associated protein 2 isoform X2 [Rana temporaria]
MSSKKALCDLDVMDFQDLYGSPAKSETSSVDLYDGLDMSVTVPDETTKPSSPSRDCLDLYEEIIAEEGTAKEASFNNLNTEYEKCQKQMKQLVSKLKEMQCLNNNLQNENQCLKKNISALIKTARVELTRKEDEINRLNQQLCVPGSYRSFKSAPAPLLSINTKLKNKELSEDAINKTCSIRKEVKPQETSSKDPISNTSSTKGNSELVKSCLENNSESSSKMEQKQCKENEGTDKPSSSIRKEVKPQTSSKDPMSSTSSTKGNSEPVKSCLENNSESSSKMEQKQCKENEGTDKPSSSIRKEVKPQTSSKDPMSSTSSTKGNSEPVKSCLENNSESSSKMEQKQCKENEGTDKPSSSIRKEVKPQETSSKDPMSNTSSTKGNSEPVKSCLENNSESNSKMEQKQCKENEGTEKPSSRHKLMVDKKSKKEMDSDSQSRDVGRRQRSEGHRSSPSTVTDDGVCEIKEKSHGQPTKTGKSESSQGIRNSKKSDVESKTDSRKHSSSSHDKPSFSKENPRGQELHHIKEKHLKTHEKSEHRKESKGYERDKTVGHRTNEKDDEFQRLKRTHSSSLKNEYSQKSSPSEQNVGKGIIESDRKDKRCSEYSDSKNISKDSKSSKTEVRPPSSKNKQKCDSKSLTERENRTEKRSKNEENIRSDQNHRGHRKEEKVSRHSSNKVKVQGCPSKVEVQSQNFAKGLTCQREDNSVKDLKLSFMETLNLTLSPAKKKSQDSESANSPVSTGETDMNSINAEASSKVCTSSNDGTDSHEHLSKPNSMYLKPSTKMSVENPTSSDDLKLVPHSEPVKATVALHKEQITVTIEDKALAEAALSNVDCPHVLHMEPEANISDDMDTQSILNESDFIVLDSYIETDKCSSNEIPSENLNMSLPAENVQNNEVILAQISEDVDQTNGLKPNITGSTKDLPSDVNISTPNELNKENCKPVNKTDVGSETFPIEISSDEVEEGEIISDEEPDNEQSSQSKSSPSQTKPIKDTNVSKSPEIRESKKASLIKPNGVISPLRQSTSKTKKQKNNKMAKLVALPIDKGKNVSDVSCLDGVLQIVPPTNIQDVLQMLRVIRNHIRRKYMKFKMQIPLSQFHRFVEASSLCFTTLANSLDWSRLCSSPDKLQKQLCKLIESRLKQLKNNGIVDRIFEQRLIDMKKRLWKFVEEQLDSLFDTLKGMTVQLCDKSRLEDNQDENKRSTLSTTKVKKSDRIKSQKVNKTSKAKASLAKLENERFLRRLDFQYQRDAADSKPQAIEDPIVEKKRLKDLRTTYDKNCISPSNHMSPKPKMPPSSTAKRDTSNEFRIDQQSSAGLSFNLVSDDHMGDIFKTLLNDSDNLELNTLHENIWILDTPEKKSTSSQKYDSVNSLTEIKTPIMEAFPWTSISPPHINTLPRHETILTPDVFDESCLLEVPTSTSSSKSISFSEDRFKSYSVLMEDLAVSLTVPSPLKSDSHLSFLRPVCDPESISKISAHFCENAVLDEEDATEQDIHLTLDSDNSSTGSMENSNEPDGFQCHPSEPMQAVIMEKSNDHFIVKIRRAVSASSPVSDSSSVVESDVAATDQLESTHCYILDENLQKGTHTETKNSLLAESPVPYSEERSFSKIDAKSANFTDVKPSTCSSPITAHAKISILTDALNQSLTDTSEVELKNVLHSENSQLDSEKLMTVYTEKYSKEDDEIMTPVEEQLIYYDKMETSFTEEIITSQTPCADMFMGSIPEAESVDVNPKKKKRKSSEQGPSSKRRNVSFLSDNKDEKEGSRCSKTEDQDKPLRKHKRAVSEGNVDVTSFKLSPNGGISAKNVIKKKGEVVVSWTRNEDRDILLECQQHGPNRKTFSALASKMSKYPHQVEERFRQLMKLFKKSRNSIS